MKESKGWEFLTAFEEIDEKYIYQAAKPWKENKIVIVQHYIRGVACLHPISGSHWRWSYSSEKGGSSLV